MPREPWASGTLLEEALSLAFCLPRGAHINRPTPHNAPQPYTSRTLARGRRVPFCQPDRVVRSATESQLPVGPHRPFCTKAPSCPPVPTPAAIPCRWPPPFALAHRIQESSCPAFHRRV